MRSWKGWCAASSVGAALAWMGAATLSADKAGEEMLAHMVYFTLKENTPENREKLVSLCHKYLSDHEGTVFYAAGTRGEEFDREVNARDFDVSLNLVFTGKEAHDAYQVSEKHLKFVAEIAGEVKEVKVYDSYVTKK
jgi:hypothetical protein